MRILLPAALVFAILQSAAAADYYVAPSGRDDSSGSLAAPWRTVGRAVGHAALGAGDTIHVRAGTYAEQVRVTRSGAAGNPITLRAYAGEQPVIDGNGIVFETWPTRGGVVQVTSSHVVIDGLRVINSTAGQDSIGIVVRGPGVTGVVVRNCSTDNTRSSGIAVWGQSSDYNGVTNVLIENNTITNAVNNGYQECLTIAGGVDSFEIRGNTVRDSYNAPHPPNIPLGIDAKINVRNGKIHHNRVYNLPYCSGIYVDGWDSTAYNIDIYSNVIHHVGHGGISIGAEEAGTVYNINVFNNLIYATKETGISVNHSNVATPPTLRDIRITHNTIYGCGYYAAHFTTDTPNVVVANNIFSQNGWSNAVTAYSSNKANLTVVNNITDGVQNAWLAGQEIVRGSAAITASPRFVDVDNADFRLATGSPAIDAGTATYATARDLQDHARPVGAGYDLGAYEYGSSSTPGNAAPTVSLTQPSNGAGYSAPATIALAANASDADGSVTRVEFWNGGSKLGEDSSSAGGWTYTWSAVPAGSYSVTAKAFDNGSPSLSATSAAITVTVTTPVAQSSYGNAGNPWRLLADGTVRLEAENYDVGGQGVAYQDSDVGNNGGSYRSDDVDLYATSDAGGGHAVGWAGGGEWLEFSVDVPATGSYDLRVRAARGITGSGTLRLLAKGVDVSGVITVSGTGGWDAWTTVTTANITLSAGLQVLRLENYDACNLNWLELKGLAVPNAAPSVTLSTPSTGTAGTAITLSATASDSDGSIARVEFFVGGTLVATDSSAPYAATWTPSAAGSYAVTATATDNLGASTVSAVATVTVSAPAPAIALSSTTVAPGGQLTVTVSGGPGNTTDWVGVFLSTTPVGNDEVPGYWQYLNGSQTAPTSGRTSATLVFTMPTTVGSYDIRFCPNNGYTPMLARSATVTVSAAAVGTGLQASYFTGRSFDSEVLRRTDTTVDFDWGSGAPASNMGADYFSVRWSGQVQAQFSETYTFSTLSDDGVRLWVNGQQLIDNWTDHAPTENSATIALVAGQRYDLRMEFYENDGGAVAKLSWASASTAKQIIPTARLFPSGSNGLPAGWTAQDVGSVATAGATTHSAGSWTVTGSGADIWGSADGFRFAYQRLSGDVQLTARVDGLSNTDAWAKAGVMIRSSLTAGSAHASTFATSANGIAFQRRASTAGASDHTAGPGSATPYWVRIERVGDVVISSASPNGSTWTEIRREAISLGAVVYVGLAVTSHSNGVLCTGTFSNVQIVGAAAAAN